MNISELQSKVHLVAVQKGHWDKPRNDGEIIALIHSEVSEALEALRKTNGGNLGEELADVVIRVMDFAESKRINLENEIVKKTKFNKTRPYKHGKKF